MTLAQIRMIVSGVTGNTQKRKTLSNKDAFRIAGVPYDPALDKL